MEKEKKLEELEQELNEQKKKEKVVYAMSVQNNSSDLSKALKTPDLQKLIAASVGSRKEKFISDLISVTASNPKLNKCNPIELINTSIKSTALNLSLEPSLGECYVIPFENKKKKTVTPTFQIGAKGLLQLAYRTEQYTNIHYTNVRDGEMKYNKFNGQIEFIGEKPNNEIIGYLATFTLKSGLIKNLFMTNQELINHALMHSQSAKYDLLSIGNLDTDNLEEVNTSTGPSKQIRRQVKLVDFKPMITVDGAPYEIKKNKWGYTNDLSNWFSNFDAMASKTVLKLLISRWGVKSTEMQNAITYDSASFNESNEMQYVDNIEETIELPSSDEEYENLTEEDKQNIMDNVPDMDFDKGKEIKVEVDQLDLRTALFDYCAENDLDPEEIFTRFKLNINSTEDDLENAILILKQEKINKSKI